MLNYKVPENVFKRNNNKPNIEATGRIKILLTVFSYSEQSNSPSYQDYVIGICVG